MAASETEIPFHSCMYCSKLAADLSEDSPHEYFGNLDKWRREALEWLVKVPPEPNNSAPTPPILVLDISTTDLDDGNTSGCPLFVWLRNLATIESIPQTPGLKVITQVFHGSIFFGFVDLINVKTDENGHPELVKGWGGFWISAIENGS